MCDTLWSSCARRITIWYGALQPHCVTLIAQCGQARRWRCNRWRRAAFPRKAGERCARSSPNVNDHGKWARRDCWKDAPKFGETPRCS